MDAEALIGIKAEWDRRADETEAVIDRERRNLAFIRVQQARVIGALAAEGVYFLEAPYTDVVTELPAS